MDGGKKVWVPDNEHGFRLGEIVDLGSDTISVEVDGAKGKVVTAPYDRVFPSEKDNTRDFEDNCSLMFLNEATLLHNLKIRYQKDKIYTYVANILLAVNPYHEIKELYSKERIKEYHGKSLGVLPPHVFAIADKAYRDMRAYKQSQSLIVSGESGAGKTESTKYILRYLTESWGSGDQGRIEQRIIEANPLLESFGNAKTMRNINSSRFGKYVEVHFNEKVTVVGGFISHYLLEKSRICKQSKGERNYHVFYRLCSGAPQQIKSKLGITKAEDFLYLKQGSITDPNLDDASDYRRMDESMNRVGFSGEEKANIFRVVAAVLHVGNISFEDSGDTEGGSVVSPKSMNSLNTAAKLLDVSSEELRMSLTTRTMSAGGSNMRVPLKPEQACAARDALAKALYTKLFDHIVGQINQCFPFKDSFTYIGVLDIAGFEYYEFNSFEQFCINYCNEKLQQLFNDRILKQEQELYDKEGLGVKSVTFVDNQDCIALIEAKKTGIIDILDEESKLPKPTAEHFTRELHQKHKNHFRLALPRKSHLIYHKKMRDDEGFLIRHFAGAVCYQTSDFIEKDNDALHSDLEELIQDSKDSFLKSLFPGVAPKNNDIGSLSFGSPITRSGSRKLGFISVGNKFRKQLNQLMEKLDKTGASFIRCIKPNGKMTARDFEGGSILSQLECAGMVSVLNLMQDGWPSRAPFKDLYQMYKDYLPPRLARLDPRMFCKALFHALGMDSKDYKFGLSKIFFRPGKFAEFDEIMHSDPESLKNIISKVLTWLIRTRWRRAIWGTLSVIKLMKKIEFRAAAIIRIQKNVKMFMAICRHKPRYQGIIKIRKLQVQLDNIGKLVGSLKKDQSVLAKNVEGLKQAIDDAVIKVKGNLMKRDAIDTLYFGLVSNLNKQLKDVEQRVEQQKVEEEQERLRKIQEQMELERKRREEEERKRKQEEEERKMRMEMEVRRKLEEEEQRKKDEEERIKREKEEADRQLQALKAAEEQKAREEEQRRWAMIEQERRDRELALRLTQDPDALDAEVQQAPQLPLQRALPPREKKKHDLSSWKYAELRDTINTSCDIELLEACRLEFQRRLKVYHQWKKTNKARGTDQEGAPQRAPQDIMVAVENAPPLPPRPSRPEQATASPALPPRRPQRYFCVPFVRRSNQYRDSEFKKQGSWFAHFDGQWIARQMEIHPGKPALLLVAGEDDLDMCELKLDETRLALRQGAEITVRDFEIEWQRHGGAPREYQAKIFQQQN